ncbi:CysZ protein [Xaviernesmea oryzae]|nr:CysZ protein [Xaviernesmea oryzae]
MTYAMPYLTQWLPDLAGWEGWVVFVAAILAGLGLALALALLIAPSTALVAGFFLDDIAEDIERRAYPDDPVGQPLPLGEAIAGTIKFFGIVVLGNLIALLLLLLPGVNLVAFFLVNGYLLGREYFEFAAMRYRQPHEARLFRARHSGTVFLAGMLVAAFLAVPILNLLTPLFAAGLMVHLHKALSARDAGRLGRPPAQPAFPTR